ncbi:MAG: invasion associated locus B family protein [Marinovum sp.]|nr:invasion associated locus B family protein [Marinovum sp.]
MRITGVMSGLVALLGSGAWAQEESTNQVAESTAWSVFVEDNPTECWAVSTPEEMLATRDGRAVAVRRGDVLFWVLYRPSENIKGQISYTGGYPFAANSTVTVEIGGAEFRLFTEGEHAWPESPEDDAKLVAAMKRGATAKVIGRSSRGTTTTDTFSLIGFTAMVDDAAKRCSG